MCRLKSHLCFTSHKRLHQARDSSLIFSVWTHYFRCTFVSLYPPFLQAHYASWVLIGYKAEMNWAKTGSLGPSSQILHVFAFAVKKNTDISKQRFERWRPLQCLSDYVLLFLKDSRPNSFLDWWNSSGLYLDFFWTITIAMCVRHEEQLFMILSIFVHQSVRVWPWPNWGDKPKPIDGNWSSWFAWSSCQIPSDGNLLPFRYRERDCSQDRKMTVPIA